MLDLSDDFRAFLDPGERIVWSGRPAQGVRFSAMDIFLVPFSLLWGGFAVFWEVMASAGSFFASQSGPAGSFALVFPLFGLPFVAVGLYMIAGRFAVDAWIRSRTRYALTDRRALILKRLFGARLDTVTLRNAPQLRLTLRGARGDVDFQPEAAGLAMFRGFAMWNPSLDGRARFVGIEDAAEVYRLAERARTG